MKPITVLLVDDHKLFREGVKSILNWTGGRFQVIGESNDGQEAQVAAMTSKPDIILMDIQMPNCTGLEATRVIAPQLPETKIVMLTVSDRDDDLFESLKAGAKGYILKLSASAREMTEALEQVAAGQATFTPLMATKLVSEFAAIARERERLKLPPASVGGEADESRLSERERQVLELVAEGQTNKQIAGALSISENTVRAHLRNILDKLHVNNRMQAAAYARRS
ncbi:MAG: response regulator transcription factor [Chloroflexi bacterium]|nr:response regulator transcription factor [Chloroflexota bacterium]